MRFLLYGYVEGVMGVWPCIQSRIIRPAGILWSAGLFEACGLARRDFSLGGKNSFQSSVGLAVSIAFVGGGGGDVL